MRILFASSTPLAGVCELMARTVNECWPGGEHEGRVLNAGPGRHAWYLRPGMKVRTYSIRDRDAVRAAVEWADHVACQANVGARNLGAVDLIRKKTWSFIWHGCEQNGCLDRSFHREDYKFVRWLSIGQGWIERQAKFFARFPLRVVPNVVTIHDEIHRPLPWSERVERVAFSPSNTKSGAPNDKGVQATEAALRGMPLKVLLRLPFEMCMREKRRSMLGIDELVTPSYHRSGIEFLSQGVPCMCSIGPEAERALLDATGASSMPFVNVGTREVRAEVERFLALPFEAQAEASAAARSWIETWYDPRALLERHYLPAYG